MPPCRLLPDDVRHAIDLIGGALTRSQLDHLLELANALDAEGCVSLERALKICVPIGSRDRLAAWRAFTASLRDRVAQFNESRPKPVEFALTADSKRRPPADRLAWFEGQPVSPESLAPSVLKRLDQKSTAYLLRRDKDYRGEERGIEPLKSSVADRRAAFPVHLMVDPDQAPEARAMVTALKGLLSSRPQQTPTNPPPVELTSAFDYHSGTNKQDADRRNCAAALLVLTLHGATDPKTIPDDIPPERIGAIAFRGDAPKSVPWIRPTLFSPQGEVFETTEHEHQSSFLEHVARNICDYVANPAEFLQRSEHFAAHVVDEADHRDSKQPKSGKRGGPPEPINADVTKGAFEVPKPTDAAREVTGARQEGIKRLIQWACDPDQTEPQFCALLGDLGMGKTTTSRLLARKLLAMRQADGDQTVPLPIYIDLRNLNPNNRDILNNLDAVLSDWLSHIDASNGPTAGELRQLMRWGECLLIWDGLDEILVKLSSDDDQRAFLRTLLSALPLRPHNPQPQQPDGQKSGKMLMTCRTHYFSSVADELNTLTGLGRQGIDRGDVLRLLLLPFTAEQVSEYLRRNYAGADEALLAGALHVIDNVHNLRELAQRPLTLSYIVEQIPRLDRQRCSGQRVSIVTLYDGIVSQWIERDDIKHQISREHKPRFMADLAWAMWHDRVSAWDAETLGEWFIAQLKAYPDLLTEYVPPSTDPLAWTPLVRRLQADLRNATFVARAPDDGFRFAHTSFSEYFLARRLARALTEAPVGRSRWAHLTQGGSSEPAPIPSASQADHWWSVPVPSRETLQFLGQALTELPGPAWATAIGRLEWLKSNGSAPARLLAFEYGLLAHEEGYPSHTLAGSALDGADFTERRFIGPLDLSESAWRECCLLGARFERATLDRAVFDRAFAPRIEFNECELEGASFVRADLVGGVVRECRVDGTALAEASHPPAAVIDLSGKLRNPDKLPPSVLQVPGEAPSGARLNTSDGHSGSVNSVAWDRDGRRLATASADRTARVWDPDTGTEPEPELILHGLPEEASAATDGDGCIIAASTGAWRHLSYVGAENGRLRWWPAEIFGRLPVVERSVGNEWLARSIADR